MFCSTDIDLFIWQAGDLRWYRDKWRGREADSALPSDSLPRCLQWLVLVKKFTEMPHQWQENQDLSHSLLPFKMCLTGRENLEELWTQTLPLPHGMRTSWGHPIHRLISHTHSCWNFHSKTLPVNISSVLANVEVEESYLNKASWWFLTL